MKMTECVICLVLMCLLSGYVGYLLHTTPAPAIPTIEEIQTEIGCEKIDGILGDETQRLWDLAICNQYASEWDFMYESEGEK